MDAGQFALLFLLLQTKCQLCWGLTTGQPWSVILCRLPEKGRIFCVEVLRPSQPNGVMSSAVSLPNHTFTGQA